PFLSQLLYHLFAGGKTIQPDKYLRGLAQRTIFIQRIADREGMVQSQVIVVDIMCRRYFQGARTEGGVYIFIEDDRHLAVDQRHDRKFIRQSLVPLVGGIDAYGRVAHDRFRPLGGGYDASKRLAVFIDDIVSYMIELSLFFPVFYFFVAQGGPGFG